MGSQEIISLEVRRGWMGVPKPHPKGACSLVKPGDAVGNCLTTDTPLAQWSFLDRYTKNAQALVNKLVPAWSFDS